jgi:hypothetical protein
MHNTRHQDNDKKQNLRSGEKGEVKDGHPTRLHLQGMKLLPKSPLGSSPLERGTGRGGFVLREVIQGKSCSLQKTKSTRDGRDEWEDRSVGEKQTRNRL